MSEHLLLNLMKERAHYLALIKEVYLKKQRVLVHPDEEELGRLDELHRIFLKEMVHLEEKWQSFIKKIKKNSRLKSETTDIIISLTFHEEHITQYFAYKDKIYQLLGEIERIKRNSKLLADEAFPVIHKKLNFTKNSSGMPSSLARVPLKLEDFTGKKKPE